MEKYFTPRIEDFHIGYEYQYQTNGDDWISHTIYDKADLIECIEDLELGWLRTPYLTKEQIEKEGWIGGKFTHYCKLKNDYLYGLNFEIINNTPYLQIDRGLFIVLYSGYCPSLNEFRKICKLLNI